MTLPLRSLVLVIALFLCAASSGQTTSLDTPQTLERFYAEQVAQRGIVDWAVLGDVHVEAHSTAALQTAYSIRLGDALQALDGQEVKLMGFLWQLAEYGAQGAYVLSPLPRTGCLGCPPPGQTLMVEVVPRGALVASDRPLLIEGRLELGAPESMQLRHRLLDARPPSE